MCLRYLREESGPVNREFIIPRDSQEANSLMTVLSHLFHWFRLDLSPVPLATATHRSFHWIFFHDISFSLWLWITYFHLYLSRIVYSPRSTKKRKKIAMQMFADPGPTLTEKYELVFSAFDWTKQRGIITRNYGYLLSSMITV